MLTLGSFIRAVRLGQGLSLAELARRAYLSKAYLSMVERGTRVPSDSVRRTLSEALGVDLPDPASASEPLRTPEVLSRKPPG